jgi:hypothetical protein
MITSNSIARVKIHKEVAKPLSRGLAVGLYALLRAIPPNEDQRRVTPGELIAPVKEPDVKPVFKSVKRSDVKVPVEPPNRPVPPVTV